MCGPFDDIWIVRFCWDVLLKISVQLYSHVAWNPSICWILLSLCCVVHHIFSNSWIILDKTSDRIQEDYAFIKFYPRMSSVICGEVHEPDLGQKLTLSIVWSFQLQTHIFQKYLFRMICFLLDRPNEMSRSIITTSPEISESAKLIKQCVFLSRMIHGINWLHLISVMC